MGVLGGFDRAYRRTISSATSIGGVERLRVDDMVTDVEEYDPESRR
jgi:hypothetical protein